VYSPQNGQPTLDTQAINVIDALYPDCSRSDHNSTIIGLLLYEFQVLGVAVTLKNDDICKFQVSYNREPVERIMNKSNGLLRISEAQDLLNPGWKRHADQLGSFLSSGGRIFYRWRIRRASTIHYGLTQAYIVLSVYQSLLQRQATTRSFSSWPLYQLGLDLCLLSQPPGRLLRR
jgi:hypothetical protein